jgi:3-oxoacyl-[acyl-carrier-protein] synthase II
MIAPAPDGSGLRRAMRAALDMAALAPVDIHYVNAHGTGTVDNDGMEMAAAAEVFGSHRPLLASMKGYFGHTLGAAGAIETALCLKALGERRVPGNLGLRQLPDDVQLDVPSRTIPVQHLQNILSMKSGFGGINAAVVLTAQEPPP